MSRFLQKINIPFARLAIFTIYFWFGLLKVVGESPASPMVKALFADTLAPIAPSITLSQFLIFFGLFEMLIGILFLIPKALKIAVLFFIIHIICSILPLFILPDLVWTKSWVPTMEGQYIIKNLALIGLVISIWTNRK